MKRLDASFLNPQTPSSRNALLKSTNSGIINRQNRDRHTCNLVQRLQLRVHPTQSSCTSEWLVARAMDQGAWTRENPTVYFRRGCNQNAGDVF